MAGQQQQGLVCSVLGRRRRADLWAYFRYVELRGATECLVESGVPGEEGEPAQPGGTCGHTIKGKNTTNLKRHLKTFHKDIQIADVQEPPKKLDKPPSAGGNPCEHGENMQTPHTKAREIPHLSACQPGTLVPKLEPDPGPPCCEATVLTPTPPCCEETVLTPTPPCHLKTVSLQESLQIDVLKLKKENLMLEREKLHLEIRLLKHKLHE